MEMLLMKPINALFVAMLASVATFVVQYDLFPTRVHAASLHVPSGPNWRQQMLDGYPGGLKVEHAVARMSERLDLNAEQAGRAREILQRQHDRMLALLVAGPSSMTRSQFVLQEKQAWTQTCAQLDAMLTPEQLELAHELGPSADVGGPRYLAPA
jgi:hypothetical protein